MEAVPISLSSGHPDVCVCVCASDLRMQLSRGRVGRGCGLWFESPGPHVGQELVGDLGQDVLGQPGHAQDGVPRPVHVVSERDKLEDTNRKAKTVTLGRQAAPTLAIHIGTPLPGLP